MVKRTRSYLVTGGCGFIGGHLSAALIQAGHRVRILDDLSTGSRGAAPAEADVMIGDVADRETISDAVAGMDGVFHLAAVASVQHCNTAWSAAHRTNLGGTVAVMEAARDAAASPLPVVWASSAAVYGTAQTLPLRETFAPVPLSPYGSDKLGGEIHGRAAASVFGLPNTALRFFNVFGPGQNPDSAYSGVISIFADRALRNQPISVSGDGGQTRDFVYITDVVGALSCAMARLERRRLSGRSARFDVFNVCTGQAVDILTLANKITLLAGSMRPIEHGPVRDGDIRHSAGDPTSMLRLLNFSAQTSLDAGLESLLETMREERVA